MDHIEIKKLRKELNYMQPEMAELCGVTLRTYIAWENQGIPEKNQHFLELLKIEKNRRILLKRLLQQHRKK